MTGVIAKGVTLPVARSKRANQIGVGDKEAIENLKNMPDKEEQPHFVYSGAGAINANTASGLQKNYNSSGPGNQYNTDKRRVGDDHHTTTDESTNYGPQSNSGSINYNFGLGILSASGMLAVAVLIAVLALSFPPISPPELSLSPSIIIPFRRDRDFVDRAELEDMQNRSRSGSRVGLVGLGGVGKSQLAIEYAYRVRQEHPQTWVFWVHASSGARFEDSYRKIADRLQLNGWDDPTTDVLGLVHAWLSNENHGEWKMIVDNADDAEVIFEPWEGRTMTDTTKRSSNRSLAEYLPVSPNGSIVFTSRVRDVIEGLDVSHADIINIGPMQAEVAEKLLLNKLGKPEQEFPPEMTSRLVQHLDYIPLAITQAAAYINQRIPRVTLARYIALLETDDSERVKVLQRDIRDPRRDRQASNSVIITWSLSFEHLRQVQDSAARLLALMSLFDREAIPDYLLKGHYLDDLDNKSDFESDIALLRAYSLINIGTNEHVFDMHRLVQFSIRTWLTATDELTQWQERYISILGMAFPDGDHIHWSICQALFPHVEVMARYRVTDADHLLVWAQVLYKGARYAMERGQYGIAEKMARASLGVHQEMLEPNNVMILDIIDLVALILRYQGKYEQAEAMNRQALAGCETALGVDHPYTLTSVSHLASVLQYQGKYKQAEAMNRRALAGCETVLGRDHPNTLTSVSNLATVLQYQGKYEQAEAMHRRALAGYKTALGVDHPYTLTSVSNLAVVLRYQGKFKEAETMNRRALAGYETALGVDHPYTLTSLNNLALLLQYQGKYKEAETMNRRALVGRETALGVDHPDTWTSVSNLASVLQYQGKYEQAETMNRRALAGYETALGMDHPDTLASVNNLATVLQYQGKYEQAETMNQRALAGYETALGMDHPDTLMSVSNLVMVLQYQGKYEQAETLNRRTLAGCEAALGVDHPDTLASVNNLATVLQYQGKYKEAETMNRRALAGYEAALGVDHPYTLTSLNNLALVLHYQGKYKEAEAMNRRALAGFETVLGRDHPSTLTSVSNLALLLQYQGKYKQAEAMNRRALAGRETVLGVDHPDTLTSVSNLATVLQDQGKYEQAEAMNRRALAGRKMVLG